MSASAQQGILLDDPPNSARLDSDAELVNACLSGNAAAEQALYDQHFEALHRVAFRMFGDADIADDVTQEAFVLAFARLSQFRGESRLRTWLTALLVSAAGRFMRKGRWLRERATRLNDGIPQPSASGSDLDLVAHLDAAVAALSDKLRAVLVMHDIEGFTHLEIATALRIPTGTSKGRLAQARAKLRAELTNHWKDRTL